MASSRLLPPCTFASPVTAKDRRAPRTRRTASSLSTPVVTGGTQSTSGHDGEVDDGGHGYYEYRGHRCHFERRGNPNSDSKLVLLHGFGVGTFHYRAQLEALSTEDPSRCVYALDFCGQGESWPPTDAVRGFSIVTLRFMVMLFFFFVPHTWERSYFSWRIHIHI